MKKILLVSSLIVATIFVGYTLKTWADPDADASAVFFIALLPIIWLSIGSFYLWKSRVQITTGLIALLLLALHIAGLVVYFLTILAVPQFGEYGSLSLFVIIPTALLLYAPLILFIGIKDFGQANVATKVLTVVSAVLYLAMILSVASLIFFGLTGSGAEFFGFWIEYAELFRALFYTAFRFLIY